MPSPTLCPCSIAHSHKKHACTFLHRTTIRCVNVCAADGRCLSKCVLDEKEDKNYFSLSHIFIHMCSILEEKKIKTFKLSLIPEVKCGVRRPCGRGARSGPEERGRKVRYCNKIQTRECKQVI